LDFCPRSASVLAKEDSSALVISARDLEKISRHNSEEFALIYMNLGRELSRRLRKADDRLFQGFVEAKHLASGYVFETA